MADNHRPNNQDVKLLPVSKQPEPPNIKWTKPKAIERALLPVMKFVPDLLLPPKMRNYVLDIAQRMDHAPPEIAAVALICAIGTALGNRVLIAPKAYDDWTMGANPWGLVVGRPATKKSPVMSAALKPLRQLEKLAKKTYEQDMRIFEAKKASAELLIKAATAEASKLIKQGKQAEADLHLQDAYDKMPEKPARKRYVTNDPTIEGLTVVISMNPMGVLLFRDELAGLLAQFKKSDKADYRPFFLEAWNGNGSYTSDRISRGTTDVERLTLSLLGGIQPKKVRELLESRQNGFDDDGFIERLQLAVYPDSNSSPEDKTPDQQAKDEIFALFNKLVSLPESDPESTPVIRFDAEAQKVFNEWYKQLHTRLNSTEKDTQLESHLAKYPKLLGTLALIFHAVDHDITDSVGVDSINMAIRWCEFLETHARRIYGLVGEGFQGAKSLAKRLKELPDPFQTKDFSNKGWSGLATAEERNVALDVLCERGYLHKVVEKTASKPKTLYYINPYIFT